MRAWVLACLSFGFMGSAVAAPFTMVCTSGGDMEMTYSRWDAKRSGGDRNPTVSLSFKKAKKGANAAAPAQGQCAWTHRGLDARENSPAKMSGGTQGGTTIKVSRRGTKVDLPGTAEEKLMGYVKRPGQRFSMVVAFKNGKLVIEEVH